MPLYKALNVAGLRGLADEVGHIEGKKIARRQKTAHRLGGNVVGVAVVRQLPAERLYRGIGGRAH